MLREKTGDRTFGRQYAGKCGGLQLNQRVAPYCLRNFAVTLALPAPVIVHVVDAVLALASVQFVAVQFENM